MEESKPKSRLMAMKNRLRSKQKKDDDKKSGSGMTKSASSSGIEVEQLRGKVSQGQSSGRMARSRTFEGQIEMLPRSPSHGKIKEKSRTRSLFKSKSAERPEKGERVERQQKQEEARGFQSKLPSPTKDKGGGQGVPRSRSVDTGDYERVHAVRERDVHSDVNGPPPVTRLVKPQTHPPGHVQETYGRRIVLNRDLQPEPDPRNHVNQQRYHGNQNTDPRQQGKYGTSVNQQRSRGILSKENPIYDNTRDAGIYSNQTGYHGHQIRTGQKEARSQPFNVNQYYIQQPGNQGNHHSNLIGNDGSSYGHIKGGVLRRERSVDRVYDEERRQVDRDKRQSRSLENLVACDATGEYIPRPSSADHTREYDAKRATGQARGATTKQALLVNRQEERRREEKRLMEAEERRLRDVLKEGRGRYDGRERADMREDKQGERLEKLREEHRNIGGYKVKRVEIRDNSGDYVPANRDYVRSKSADYVDDNRDHIQNKSEYGRNKGDYVRNKSDYVRSGSDYADYADIEYKESGDYVLKPTMEYTSKPPSNSYDNQIYAAYGTLQPVRAPSDRGHHQHTQPRSDHTLPRARGMSEPEPDPSKARVRGRAERRGSDPAMLRQNAQDDDDYGFRGRPARRATTTNIYTHQAEPLVHQRVQESQQQESLSGRPNHLNIKVAAAKGKKAGGGLRVTNPDDLKTLPLDGTRSGASSPGLPPGGSVKHATTRRHTVTLTDMLQDGEKKTGNQEAAFYEHLAQRFPRHAQAIRSKQNGATMGRGPDPRLDAQRRRTTQVTYDPSQGIYAPLPKSPYYEDDKMSTMSETDASPTGGFRRGGKLRNSLPVVRSPNKSLDRPMGMVFLIYRNETKRALLPNEITTLDTVKALFVRSFPDTLSMQWFENPNRKIYVMDGSTNVYYELEDLRDVKDRVVLKVYEREVGGSIPGSPLRSPKVREGIYGHGYESDSSVRSAPAAPGPRSPVHILPTRPYSQDVTTKASSLPVQSSFANQQLALHGYSSAAGAQAPGYQSPPPGHWSPTHRPLSQGQYPRPSSQQNSPQRTTPTPTQANGNGTNNQRHSVAYLPEPTSFPPGQLPQSRSYHDYHDPPDNRSSGSVTPTHGGEPSRERMDKMEAQLANLAAWVQTAVMTKDNGSRPSSARSNSSVISDGSYSAKSNSNSCDGDPYSVLSDVFLQESESTTPTVQSPTSSSQPGMSDVSSSTPHPVFSVEMQNSIRILSFRAKDLRSEVNNIRKIQIANAVCMRDTINDTFLRIKEVIAAVPGAGDQPIRVQRFGVNSHMAGYKEDASHVQKDLIDLEATVEELRTDVVSRRCRVNQGEVESMALALSNISKALAELKGKFPQLQEEMKTVMAGEMEVVVNEEKFIKEEPVRLDESLKRCKKLTGTLFTLKRLAEVQDQRPPSIPKLDTAQASDVDRKNVLENIQAVIPNHEARINSVQAAESSIERKKKLTEKTESLRFEKSLQLAQKQIREKKEAKEAANKPEGGTVSDKDGDNSEQSGTKAIEGVELRAHIPLTDTTKRLSLHGSPEHKAPLAQSESEGEFTDASSERGGDDGDDVTPTSTPTANQNGGGSEEKMTVKGGTGITNGNTPHLSAPAVKKQAPSSPSALRLSTFAPDATPARVPLAPPTASSTPKQVHVTFSTDVTEISEDAKDGGSKGKKIPPPPPPRKSSRVALARQPSPRHASAQPGRPPSPHTYENIENLGIDPEGNGNKGRGPQRPRSVGAELQQQKAPPTQQQLRPKSEYSPNRTRPLTRYQHELAEGIYANMNRPDLQGQRVRPVDVIQNSPKRGDPGREASPANSDSTNTSTSSSSIDSQIGGIVRKIHAPNGSATKERSTAPQLILPGETNGRGGIRKGKVPPPPPVRRTSALSTSGDEGNGNSEHNGTNHKPRLSNGDIPQKSVKTVTIATDKQVTKATDRQDQQQSTIRRVNKKFEETEIY